MPNGYLAERLQGLIPFLMETLVQFLTENTMIDLPLSDDIVNLIKVNEEKHSDDGKAWYDYYIATLVNKSENWLSQVTEIVYSHTKSALFSKSQDQYPITRNMW